MTIYTVKIQTNYGGVYTHDVCLNKDNAYKYLTKMLTKNGLEIDYQDGIDFWVFPEKQGYCYIDTGVTVD